ncbi:MAG: beta-ketoacyl-ACP synthase III [Alphaproteobacteria bacterium]|nr:beta-ketoacyl-ACP synthase III [Alphaproteobacteria bacterium]
MARIDCRIAGVGGYLPERVVTNAELEAKVDTNDAWIRSRTGIAQRHIGADDEATSDIAAAAAKRALAAAGLVAEDIDLIVVATVTPDRTFPSVAVHVQRKIGAPPGMAFDVSAACGGFVYALNIVTAMMTTGQTTRALVIGAEKLSCFLDWTDRGTCVLFGDGGGAIVVEAKHAPDDAPRTGVLGVFSSADGRLTELLYADGGPSTTNTVGLVRMNGREVFRNAVEEISNSVITVARQADIRIEDIDWFVPHQANIRIIESCAKRLNLNMDRVIVTIDRHANTSAASIPLALDDAIRAGTIRKGDLVAFAALGGGLAWGSALVRF